MLDGMWMCVRTVLSCSALYGDYCDDGSGMIDR